ncbi:MAG: ATP-binding protein [Planctomycetaceae bacterium]|nr:ATP-binding protein [Planctomycetaceae bacterium]
MTETKKILHKSCRLQSTEKEVQQTITELLSALAEYGFDEDSIFAIHLALEEAFLNAIKHGNHNDSEKTIEVECLLTPEKFDISISDEGFGFDPDGIPDPRCNGNLYKASGRGILLIQSYMDVVEYNSRGNCVHMIKYRNTNGPRQPQKVC